MKLKIQITSVNPRYTPEGELENVQVHFISHDDSRTININGYLPLSPEEYQGNESLTALGTIVKENLADRLTAE
ncbi:hypothetical protein [Sutcliffiella halmapala]|uniref:hypothetical protein n=1 Tax=Sutcliffiella halmapala TaxID=79882 RepID=UPI00099565D2|nr:hypothetical protein [Sutcliffiella halmapala]